MSAHDTQLAGAPLRPWPAGQLGVTHAVLLALGTCSSEQLVQTAPTPPGLTRLVDAQLTHTPPSTPWPGGQVVPVLGLGLGEAALGLGEGLAAASGSTLVANWPR